MCISQSKLNNEGQPDRRNWIIECESICQMGAWCWWKCRRSQLVGPLNGPQSGLAGWFMIFWINAWDAIMETHLSTGWLNCCKNPKQLELSHNTSYIKLHYFALCVFWYIVCVRYGVRNYSSNTKLGPTPNVKSHKIFNFFWNPFLSICQLL